MKPASSAFSQSGGRRRVSIRSASAIIGKSSSLGETAQKRELQAVEEEDFSSFQNSFDSPQGFADAGEDAAAVASGHGPTSRANAALNDSSAESRGDRFDSSPVMPLVTAMDSSASAHERFGEVGDGSSNVRTVTVMQPSSSSTGTNSTKSHTDASDRSPFDNRSDVSAVATVADSAAGALVPLTKAESARREIGQYYSNIHERLRRTAKPVAEESTLGERSRAAAAGHGWVSKVKRNIVGFFEGGDSDASSSDEETAHQTPQPRVQPSEMSMEMLQNIVVAVKATRPPIVLDHKKNSMFALSSDVLQLTFKGSALVDWLLDHSKAGEFAVQGRAQAVAIGEAMCSNGLVRNFDKGPASMVFKDAELLYRFDCDEKSLQEKEASKAPAEDSKGLSHFRAKIASSTTSALSKAPGSQEGTAAAGSAPDPAHAASNVAHYGPSLHPEATATSSDEALNSKALFLEHSSSSLPRAGRGLRPSISRISSIEAIEPERFIVNSDSAPAAVRALKTATEARISAIEARASHLRAQLDQMLALMEQKDKDIEGKLHDIELLRKELKDECSETQQGLVVIQSVWDEKVPIIEKLSGELPLLDAKIKDFEKRHEEAKDRIDEAQQKLKRHRDQQSEVAAGGGRMTWNDWFM